MRAVVQRVSEASVVADGTETGRIGPGLVVLLGVTHDDDAALARRTADKVAGLRILRDEQSVVEASGSVLVVSQFTLYGDVRKGRRPTWTAAAPGPVAEPLYDAFCAALRAHGLDVETGVFGADMQVSLVNDGPTTLLVDL
ncbi:D-tyrosyl-tRNA(Tyr) deacylase [Aeromicrobium sp. Root495]|uniref:D-aminoacyl-tRNA deacylase n=1 Tax=Aeromicrobium sp. Root495 TaxID=1736550 RepID=UPI0006FE3C89|nr:D-aminoacyl-tRNA deacylase [Aeromicrobium sp. Root495]KQY58389.1 D-tyrosyl-tRNA(Tyr) deacylase [Aeromicrobium sp. Root495]